MKSNWKEISKDLGIGNVGDTLEAQFEKLSESPRIKYVNPSCSCVSINFDKVKNILYCSLVLKNIPYHLKSQGFYINRKSINIIYEDNSNEELSFSIKVIK